MVNLKKTIKAGIAAGVCGTGLCSLSRKLKLSNRLVDFAHNIEAVPFPGTQLYSFLASKQLRTLYAAIADEIVAPGKHKRILDLATGPGFLPIEIAKHDKDAVISGLDESPDMIPIAEANANAYQLGKSVEFMFGDPTNLPFPGRYFDLVVSVNVLHHWPKPLLVFEEVYHILQPGGEFWIYDFKRDVPKELWEELEKGLPFYLRLPFVVGPVASSKAAYSKTDLLDLASQTHFEVIDFEDRTYTIFGKAMSVFNRLRLRKSNQIR